MLSYLKSRGVENQLYFVTEFGYGGLEDVDAVLEKYGDHPRPFVEDYQGFVRQKQDVEDAYAKSGMRDVFPTLTAFRNAAQSVQANAVRLHVEAMRANSKLRGYNIVQLFDSNSNEVDGLVDFWRNKRKPAFSEMQTLNQPLGLIVQCSPFNVTSGEETDIAVTLFNEGKISGSKNIRLRVVDSSGTVIASADGTFEAKPVVSTALRKRLALKGAAGRVTVEAEVLDGTNVLVKKSAKVDVYDPERLSLAGSRVYAIRPAASVALRQAAYCVCTNSMQGQIVRR